MDRVARLTRFFRRPCLTLSLSPHFKRIIRSAFGLAALAAIAIAAQGCFNTSAETSEQAYGGPAEYAAYGYSNDPFTFAAYNPFLYTYCFPQPYYYYPYYRGDGDRDCDDGFCGYRGAGKPHPKVAVGSVAPRLPIPHGSAVAEPTQLRSGNLATHSLGGGNVSAGGYHGGIGPMHGFGGGGLHGSFHR